jgi:transposase
MVEGTVGSHHKEGSSKMSKSSTVCGGIDTGKYTLDAALADCAEQLQVGNDAKGHATLSAWLKRHDVKRVGIEASGGYEQQVVARLRRDGFVVVVFQPAQVRAYAKFVLQRAKNDKIDAALIAECTAAAKKIYAPPDPRLVGFAEQMTLIDQLTEQIAICKNYRASSRAVPNRQHWKAEIARLNKLLRTGLKDLVAAIREHRDLAERLELIESVDGVGLKTAVAILVRMPEIGRVSRGQAAALAGLAPYDDDSGTHVGIRHIAGGRERLRGALYKAALAAAFHWNPHLIALYRRLTAAGKEHKVALIACARKLLIFINTVVERGTPWLRPKDQTVGSAAHESTPLSSF